MRYQIVTGRTEQHIVHADGPDRAIQVWMDLMGYESRAEAARECYCKPKEIKAVLRSFE